MAEHGDAPWQRGWPDRSVPDGQSTFGAALSLADEEAVDVALNQARAGAASSDVLPNKDDITARLELDHQLALGSRRWSENVDGVLFQHDSQFVPGDVVAIRSSAVQQAARLASDTAPGAGVDPNRFPRLRRAAHLTQLIYAARPYWLPHAAAWGVMATKPLEDEDRNDLVLPSPALIMFSSPMEITAPYVATDLRLIARLNTAYDLPPDSPANETSIHPEDHAPFHVRGGTLGILRYYNRLIKQPPDQPEEEVLFDYQLVGVLVAPTADGSLSDAVVWLLRRINPNIGATTKQVVQGQGLTVSATSGTFSLVEGNLSRSLLRPIAEALAAVVAWGTWTPPDHYGEPIATGRDFRKQIRKSGFKKAEARGQLADVQVLAVREPSVTYTTDSTPTGRTLAPHYRVGHWQRYRVGARDDWTYERRRKAPRIINAGADDLENQVRIYRLPAPPLP